MSCYGFQPAGYLGRTFPFDTVVYQVTDSAVYLVL